MRRLWRVLALPGRERYVLLEAIIALTIARALLAALPFKRAMHLIGLRTGIGGNADPGGGKVASEDVMLATVLGRAIHRAARHMPFCAVCLQQAMACAIMLRRRRLV